MVPTQVKPKTGEIRKADDERPKKEFDFTRHPERRIALMFLYFGWEFNGMVRQPNEPNTTEEHILNALEKTKTIRSKEYCQWNRCGRTDKNVSGFRQIGSCIVRSADANGKYVEWPEDAAPSEKRVKRDGEINYAGMLNATLPSGCKILAWAPVRKDFSARFECTGRAYKYVFPRADMNIEGMIKAANYLVGEHDYRNFCQIDDNKCRLDTSYVREIYSADISSIPSSPSADEAQSSSVDKYQMYALDIKGSGFLWHQIRFIVSLLFEIGRGNETPELILELLDVEKCPARPQYNPAKDLPLCFFDCSFGNTELDWVFDSKALNDVFIKLQQMWAEAQTKAEIIRSMINEISGITGMELDCGSVGIEEFLRNGSAPRNHIPIMERRRCLSLAERIAKAEAKK